MVYSQGVLLHIMVRRVCGVVCHSFVDDKRKWRGEKEEEGLALTRLGRTKIGPVSLHK